MLSDIYIYIYVCVCVTNLTSKWTVSFVLYVSTSFIKGSFFPCFVLFCSCYFLFLDPFPCSDFSNFIPRSEDHGFLVIDARPGLYSGHVCKTGPNCSALPCPGTPLAQNKDSPASVCANLLLLPMPYASTSTSSQMTGSVSSLTLLNPCFGFQWSLHIQIKFI